MLFKFFVIFFRSWSTTGKIGLLVKCLPCECESLSLILRNHKINKQTNKSNEKPGLELWPVIPGLERKRVGGVPGAQPMLTSGLFIHIHMSIHTCPHTPSN